ncbi:PAS domain S-box protein [Cyclobacterium qasimii]|nr:PAS domain S-box protein [Cyclobacterium qasimii]
MSHINKTITRVNDQQTLLNEACRIAVEIGDFKMAWIGMADNPNHKVKLVASHGTTKEDIKLLSDEEYHIDDLSKADLQESEYLTVPNIQEEEHDRWNEYAGARGFISAISLRIKKAGMVIGTFNMYSAETNLFSEKEIKMLKEVVDDISFGIDLFEKEEAHKNTLKLVAENELRFRALIENSPDMKTLITKEGKVYYCSPSVKKSLGYTFEEYLELNRQDLIHPEDLLEYLENWDNILHLPGQSFYFRQRRLHKNGNWVWCEGSVTNMLEQDAIKALVSNFRDISEKRDAEKLHEFDINNLKALNDSTFDLMWSVDLDFKLITSNNSFDKMIERNFGDKIPKGGSILLAAYAPERLNHYKKQYKRAFSGEVFVEAEHSFFPVEAWSEIFYYPIRKGNEIIGTACYSRDITNIKKAENELRKSKEFNSGVINALSAHIAVLDALGFIVAVNDSWKKFAIDKGDIDFLHAEIGSNYFKVCLKSAESGYAIAAEVLMGIREVLEEKRKDFYLEYPCHSPKEQRWFGMHVKRFEMDEALVVIAHQEITERKLAENKLIITNNQRKRALRELFKIMDSSLDVICAVDAQGRFLKVSAASEAVWGYKPKELIGKPLINFVYGQDDEKTQLTAASLMEGNHLGLFENRYVRKDGSLVPIEWSARWDIKDQVRYGIARDVTEKKRLENAFVIERQQFFDLFSKAPSSMGVLSGPNHLFVMANPPFLQTIGKVDVIGKSVLEMLPEVLDQGYIAILDKVYQTGNAFSANEMLIKLDVENKGELVDKYLNILFQPHRGADDKVDGILFFTVNVSEQVLSRKTIEESEARLNEAQALSHISNWGIDLVTGIHTWSAEFYAIFGIKHGDLEPSVAGYLSFIHPEDAEDVKQIIQKTLEDYEAAHFYSRIITKDGLTKYIYSEWDFEFDKNGNPLRFFGVLQDITEHKLIEEKIIESEAKLKAAQAIAHIGSWELDFETKDLILSDEGARLFGLPANQHELSSEDWVDFAHPDDRKMIQNKIEKSLLSLSPTSFDHRIVRKDGTVKHIHSESKFRFDIDGKPSGINGTMQDVTKSFKSAEKLKHSERRFREFFKSAPESIVVIDTTTMTFVKYNENALELLKYSAKELMKKGPADISPMFQSDGRSSKSKGRDLISKAVKGKKTVFEWVLIDGNGKEFTSEVRLASLSNVNGPLLIVNFADITQRKENEKGMVAITSDLMQRNKDLEQFTYIVSHNLRAPVANIMGLSEALRTIDLEEAEREELMDGLSVSVVKLNGVIFDLNNILQLKNNLSEKRERVSFSDLIENIQLSINDQIIKQDVLIRTDFSEVGTMMTLKSYLYSIFYNLISNSIKFRQPNQSPSIAIKSFKFKIKLKFTFRTMVWA